MEKQNIPQRRRVSQIIETPESDTKSIQQRRRPVMVPSQREEPTPQKTQEPTKEAELYNRHPIMFSLLFALISGVIGPLCSFFIPDKLSVSVKTRTVSPNSTIIIDSWVWLLAAILFAVCAAIVITFCIRKKKNVILPLLVLMLSFVITFAVLYFTGVFPTTYQDVYSKEEWTELSNTSMKFELGTYYTYNWNSGKLESDCWDFDVVNDGSVKFIFTHDIEDNIKSDAWRITLCNADGKVIEYRFISMDAAKTEMDVHLSKGKYYLTFKVLNDHYRDNPLHVDSMYTADSL